MPSPEPIIAFSPRWVDTDIGKYANSAVIRERLEQLFPSRTAAGKVYQYFKIETLKSGSHRIFASRKLTEKETQDILDRSAALIRQVERQEPKRNSVCAGDDDLEDWA